ncbi:MAG: DNA internalization-related competence protein ComEC/Rec2 [Deltaproteobacteria bacterium]|nr:DNA internalization-related competence protein ComEC/Rec2 [Deltaproteobacteria bacterium]
MFGWRTPFGAIALSGLLLARIAGLLLADSVRGGARLLPLATLAALGAAPFVRARLRLVLSIAAVLTASAGGLAERLERAIAERPSVPFTRTLEGRVVARDTRPGWIRLDLREVAPADGGGAVPGALRVEGKLDAAVGGEARAIVAGDRIRARVVLEAPRTLRNPGGRDASHPLAREGIGAVGRLVDPLLIVRRVDDAASDARRAGWIERLRARAGERLAREGPGGELLRALACGERAAVANATRLAFQELGLSHLLSVSGLHLVLVAGLAYGAAAGVLRRIPRLTACHDVRRLALAGAFVSACFYALFAGFEVPVQRSLVFVGAGALALARRRPLRTRSALVAAGLLVLAARPTALFDAGAQMSFAASAALLALRREGTTSAGSGALLGRLRSGLHGLISTSAAATAATAPIAATHLGVIAPAGLVANLAFVPWTGIALLPAALAGAALAAAPGELALETVAIAGCAQIASWTSEVTEQLAAWTPDLRPAPPPGAVRLAACAGLALAAVRAPALGLRVFAAALSCLLLATARPAPIAPQPPRAVFLDVGQGDAILVQGREGVLLVDAGLALPDGLDLGRSVVVPALAALGVSHLDLVIVTHGDTDHRGGVPAVLRGISVGEVWLPAGALADPAFAQIRDVARSRFVGVSEVSAGEPARRIGDLVVTPLWPPAGDAPSGSNNRSIVVRVATPDASLVLPGDAEAESELALVASGADLRGDVLKLGHHGSRTSTTQALLAAVLPRAAIASAPCAGRFGMPHPEVVERLGAAGVPWYWTGRDGAVLVALSPDLGVRAFGGEPLACLPGRRRGASPRCTPGARMRA